MTVTQMFGSMRLIDADTHLTEPHDLWTSRAPRRWKDRLPRVETIDGDTMWTFDGVVLGRAGASGIIGLDGKKRPGTTFFNWHIEDIHPGAYSVDARLAMMDEQGIWAQIVYPNTVGLGGEKFCMVRDSQLMLLAVTIFNDAMAEIQESSGDRLFPMGHVPVWDIDESVNEIARIHDLGLRGINITSAPHDLGLPDLGDPAWDPVWEAASDLGLPVNFHVAGSGSAISFVGEAPWPSQGAEQKLGIGSAMSYVHNAVVLSNLIYSGVLERFPTLQFVSVESGVGWIPFLLRALDYQVSEMVPGSMDYLSMTPLEYFRRQVHACFWFERQGIAEAIDLLGPTHLMFETDFPHPTCLFPDGLDFAADALAGLDHSVQADVMGGNAARLYRIPLPDGPVER